MNEQYDEAVKQFGKSPSTDPRDVKDHLELGDMILEKKAYAEAKTAFTIALKTSKRSETVHKKLGFVSLAMNDKQQAKKSSRRSDDHPGQ